MGDWNGWDFFFLIPKLKRFYFDRINKSLKRKRQRHKIILAWIYTILSVIVILLVLGATILFGARYEVPIIKNVGDWLGIKYLYGADKFSVKIDPSFQMSIGENRTIPFTINSYKEGSVWLTVNFRPYEDNSFIPSYSYTKRKLLSAGESEDNIININISSPHNTGRFEICINIDDKTFFSVNKYEDCPSVLKVIG